MKQTAVEYLYKNLLDNPMSNEDVIYNINVFEKAKEMEEQNTIEILERYHNSLFNILLKEGEAKRIVEHIKKGL